MRHWTGQMAKVQSEVTWHWFLRKSFLILFHISICNSSKKETSLVLCQREVLLTFGTERHLDGSPAGLLFGQQAELQRRARRHFWSRKVPVLPAYAPTYDRNYENNQPSYCKEAGNNTDKNRAEECALLTCWGTSLAGTRGNRRRAGPHGSGCEHCHWCQGCGVWRAVFLCSQNCWSKDLSLDSLPGPQDCGRSVLYAAGN